MDQQFWIERWQKGETAFNQPAAHDLLARHWASLEIASDGAVLVPLCGKSVDMVWLAEQGHGVIGAELSPLAVQDFFQERGLDATAEREGAFDVYKTGPFAIWCGDFLALPRGATQAVAGVYDRAALVALPSDLKVRYVEKLNAVLPKAAPIFLVSLDYPAGAFEGPPFSTPPDEVRALFEATHEIAILESRDALETSPALKQRGVPRLTETIYVLRSK